MKLLKMKKDIIITHDYTEDQKDEIVDLLYNAFEKELKYLEIRTKSQEQAIRIMRESINYENFIYASHNNRVIGLAGLTDSEKKAYHFSWKLLRKEFGFFGALRRGIEHLFHNEKLKSNELYLCAVAVATSARGKGIGTSFIHYAIDLAKERDYEIILLDVNNNNERAHKLYKKLGFIDIKKRNFGFLTKKAGFTAVYRMRKELKNCR